MTLHEAMHAFVGYWLGDDTAKLQGRLTLNPIKHIDPFLTIILPLGLALVSAPIFGGAKPVPFNPHNVRWGEWGAALIALAGPFTNLFIAFLAFGVATTAGINVADFRYTSIGDTIATLAVIVNIGFFVFNSLPIPPLDGSRFIYALAPEFIRRGMEYIERFGIIFVFVLVLVASPFISVLMVNAVQFFVELFSRLFIL